jgi:hypothetical protein
MTTAPRGRRVGRSLKKKKTKTKYSKNVPKCRSRKATFKHSDDPRSVIDNNNFEDEDNNNENEERINTMNSTSSPKRGVSVSDEDDDHDHDHDHDEEYYYDAVDSEEYYDWTNKITAIASSSGNLMEDIIHGANNGQDGDDCGSDWEEESTTCSITTATVIEVDLLDMNMDIIGDDGDKFNNLNDIFNHPEVYQQEQEQEQDDDNNHREDHDVDLLDGNSFVVFGNDYPGSSNNTCCNNINDDDDDQDDDEIDKNEQTMKTSDAVNNIPVHVGPKTSRINPMIGERSFTDDIKQDEITTILSNNAPVPRRKYKKRKSKGERTTRSISRSYSLRRSISASKEEEEKRQKIAEKDNTISAASFSPPPISLGNNESDGSSSIPSAAPPTCTTTRKPTRKRELRNLASYNKFPNQEKKKRFKSMELKNLSSHNKVPNQEKKRHKTILSNKKQDSLLLSNANTTRRSEYELQSSSYSYFTLDGSNENDNVLPRRIAKKFLYRPANNNLYSDEGESCNGNVRSKPFFGTVIVKGLQEKQDDDDGDDGDDDGRRSNTNKTVWYVVYDDGDEDVFDEIEYQKGIDQYERLKRWDTNGTDIITSIQHAWG